MVLCDFGEKIAYFMSTKCAVLPNLIRVIWSELPKINTQCSRNLRIYGICKVSAIAIKTTHALSLSLYLSILSNVCTLSAPSQLKLPCDLDESDAAPEFSIVIGGEFSRTHDISPADICVG